MRNPMDATYQALFATYNQQYFAGRLPAYRVVVVSQITSMGEDGDCNRKLRRIRLRRDTKDNMIATLLHEMAHAATNEFHGPRWRQEIQHLVAAGAPLPPEEATLAPKPTLGLIRDAILDTLIAAAPTLAFRDFLRGYAQLYAVSAPSLLRKYPSLPRIFTAAKQRYATECKRREDMLRSLHHP